jgi:hypothetical protein
MKDAEIGANGTYRTSGLYVAVWLLTRDLELQDIDHSNSRRFDFIFTDQQDSPDLAHWFLRGRAVAKLADFNFYLRGRRVVFPFERECYVTEGRSLCQGRR